MDQQTDDCAQGYYWTLPLSGWGGSRLPAAYQSPTALRHRRARSHYACTQSHTQSTLFATTKQPPRSLALAPQQQRACETRGLQVLIAAHAMLWPTWRLCSSARRTREHFRSCQSPPGSDRSHGVPCTAILPIRAVLYGSPVAVQASIDFAAQSGVRRCLLYTCTFTTDCARVGTCNFLTCARWMRPRSTATYAIASVDPSSCILASATPVSTVSVHLRRPFAPALEPVSEQRARTSRQTR